MKLLHTSDWHLGINDNEISLYDDQIHFINEICNIIKEKNIDAVLLAGDIYHRSNPSNEAIALYSYAMTKICDETNTPILAITGNHDSAEKLINCAELLKSSGLYISGKASNKPYKVDFDDTEIFLLPWITQNKVKSIYPNEAENINSLTDAYSVMSKHIKDEFTEGKKHIIVSHAFMTQAETSTSDNAAEIGTAEQIALSVFDGFDYVALGHIHKPQNVGDNARYSGTPMAYSFGKEETQVKSVTIIDTATMQREIVLLNPLHKRCTITATLAEMLRGEYDDDIKNGYTNLVVTDSFVGTETISKLRTIFKNIVQISGKSYEGNGTITMTMAEFEKLQTSPEQIFERFYIEILKITPTDHQLDLFNKAMSETEDKA